MTDATQTDATQTHATQTHATQTHEIPTPGRLYGLGIGPGDPELLTLKAHRILTSVPVIAYPTMENGKVLARAIVSDFIRPTQIELPMPLPFSVERSSQPAYDIAAAKIAEHLTAGRDVAVLCEGEPMLYGSFMYIFNRLAGAVSDGSGAGNFFHLCQCGHAGGTPHLSQ